MGPAKRLTQIVKPFIVRRAAVLPERRLPAADDRSWIVVRVAARWGFANVAHGGDITPHATRRRRSAAVVVAVLRSRRWRDSGCTSDTRSRT